MILLQHRIINIMWPGFADRVSKTFIYHVVDDDDDDDDDDGVFLK